MGPQTRAHATCGEPTVDRVRRDPACNMVDGLQRFGVRITSNHRRCQRSIATCLHEPPQEPVVKAPQCGVQNSDAGSCLQFSLDGAGQHLEEHAMLRKILFASAAVFVMGTAAHASQCPTLMNEIDAKLQTANLSDEDMARVMELRQLGEEQHEAGDHPASEASLQEALEILGD